MGKFKINNQIITSKKKLLFDNYDLPYGFSVNDTLVVIKDADTGEVIFKNKNKVILPGSEFTAKSHFDLDTESVVGSYSDIMNLDTDAATTSSAISGAKERVYLFCVGTDGCGPEASQKYPVNYIKAMLPVDLVDDPTLGHMIPFRFMSTGDVLDKNSTFRSKYFGRRIETIGNTGGTWIAYYFKRFETDPVLVRQFVDGTTITKETDIYHSSKTDEAQCYVQLKLKIAIEDCRDYFARTTGTNTAKWNSLSLCTAIPATYTINGTTYSYYKDIRPFTKLHIPNESLIDSSKQYDIIYHIYY